MFFEPRWPKATEVGAELSRLVAPLAPRDREHFRAALAEIIAGHGAVAN